MRPNVHGCTTPAGSADRRSSRGRWESAVRIALCLLIVFPAPGCSRRFWREQAEMDSYEAIAQRMTDPRWQVPRVDLNADPRSRFFDPYDPDCAPLPPDDPAAHQYMHWVDGWEGYKCWHKFGQLMSVENPNWLAQYGLSPEMQDPVTGEYIQPVPAIEEMTLGEAIDLSVIHNRDYQTNLENVFLSALDVAAQRFQFAVRYIGNGPNDVPSIGSATTVGENGRTGIAAGGAISQMLPFGAQWILQIANEVTWTFAGNNNRVSATVLSYRIVQPLLRDGTRKVALENLTQAERNLLYDVRTLARFRKELFSDVVATGNGNYLGLLQQLQAILNEQGNIRRLEEQVERLLAEASRGERFARADLQALPPGLEFPDEFNGQLEFREELGSLFWRGTISDAQVEILRNLSDDPAFERAAREMIQSLRTEVATLDVLQLQSRLTDSINRLRGLERGFQDSLDAFKFLLGLPPEMYITIDAELLKPFEIIDLRLSDLEERAKDFVDIWAQANVDDVNELESVLAQFSSLIDDVDTSGVAIVKTDLERLRGALDQRKESFDDPIDQERLQSDFDRAEFLFEKASADLAAIQESVAGLNAMLESSGDDEEARIEINNGINFLREELIRLVQNLTVIQVSLRVEFIEVIPFEMGLQEVERLAVENRLDLMNQRAIVMDARRQVEIAANDLKSALDVRADGQLWRTGPQNRDHTISIQFDTPLDKNDERNRYRDALLRYQRAKRTYMQAEDNVKRDVRGAWRQLYVLRKNLETSRRAVRIAALQYDSAVNEGSAPVDPNQVNRGGSSGLQGQNLLNALNSILNAQNDLIRNWVSYEQNRIQIYRDMGIMEIGPDGVWEDPFYREQTNDAQPSLPVDSLPIHPLEESDEPEPAGGEGPVLGDAAHRSGSGDRLDGGAARPEVDQFFDRVELVGGEAR